MAAATFPPTRWMATDEEVEKRLPGGELVPDLKKATKGAHKTRRSFPNANPTRLGFILVSRNSEVETTSC